MEFALAAHSIAAGQLTGAASRAAFLFPTASASPTAKGSPFASSAARASSARSREGFALPTASASPTAKRSPFASSAARASSATSREGFALRTASASPKAKGSPFASSAARSSSARSREGFALPTASASPHFASTTASSSLAMEAAVHSIATGTSARTLSSATMSTYPRSSPFHGSCGWVCSASTPAFPSASSRVVAVILNGGIWSASKPAVATRYCFPCVVCAESATEATLTIDDSATVVVTGPETAFDAMCSCPCVVCAESATEATLSMDDSATVLFTDPATAASTEAPIPTAYCFVTPSAACHESAIAAGFHLTGAAFVLPTSSACLTATGSLIACPALCSSAMRFICLCHDAASQAAGHASIGSASSLSWKVAGGWGVAPAYQSTASSNSLSSLPNRAVSCTFLHSAGSWPTKAHKLRFATRCNSTRRDDMGTMSLLDWDRLVKVSLLCLVLQKSLQAPSRVQRKEIEWKRILSAFCLLSCLIIGHSAARDNQKMAFFVKVLDGALKCFKVADEISKLIFK